MKLISVNALKVGEMLGTHIRASKGHMLLKSGSTLTSTYIQRLKSVGIYSVYVEDELFDNLEIQPALTDDTKIHALETVSDIHKAVLRNATPNIEEAKKISREIYEEVRVTSSKPINLINTYAVDYPILLHSVNVAVIVAALAINSNIRMKLAEDFVTAALLHDVALENLDDDKNASHAEKAMQLLKGTSGLNAATFMAVAMHHERFDGKGFPRGLSGENINDGARLIAVADTYDNMVFGHGGAKRLPFHQAAEFVMMESGRSLDPEYVKMFANSVAVYPVGATVLLNNGQKAVVINQNTGMPMRPVVKLIRSTKDECIEFNLVHDHTLFIEKIEL